MNKYICVNMDKEEFITIGELPKCSLKNCAEINTLKYLFATDWSGDRIAFAYDGMKIGKSSPSVYESLYECAVSAFDERTVLDKVPEYRYVLNITKEEYYDKECIPIGDDNTFFDPVSLLLLADYETDIEGMLIGDDEKREVGIWTLNSIKATNNIAAYSSFSKINPNFKNEKYLKSKKLDGLRIVVTGTFPGFDRYEIEKFIESNGGISQKSVTKKTDYLVVAYNPGKSKLDKARAYGTKMITDKDLLKMIL